MPHHTIPMLGIQPSHPTDLPAPMAISLDHDGTILAHLPGGHMDIVYASFTEMEDAHGLDFTAHLDAIGMPSPEDYAS